MSAKHIMLSGYYGFDNAGDEAILSAMIQTFRQLDPDITISVLSRNPPKTEKRYGVQAVQRTDVKAIVRQLKHTDLFISGGGSLLQDQTGALTIPYYLGMIHLARLSKVPFAIYAQGIGPVRRKAYHKWIAHLFKKAEYISVRDPQSKGLLVQWGVPKDKIDQVVDPVFLLEATPEENAQQWLEQEQISLRQKPILFSVRNWPAGEHDLKRYALLCDKLIEDGEEVLLLPMHYPNDAETAAEIMSLMKNKVHLLQREYTPEQLFQLVSQGKLMVGMRLHALIFAAAQQIPCIGISYDPKIDAFMQLMGEKPAAYSGQLDVDVLYTKIKADLERYEEVQKRIAQAAQRLRQDALKPAQQMIRLLQQMT